MGYEKERVLEYLPWARHFAKACALKLPPHLDHEDLQNAGIVGYLKAAQRYDASRGASFRGYCALRIRGAVLDELRKWNWAPRSVHKCHKRITRITMSLAERLKREPTRGELAAELGMEEADLGSYQMQAQVRQIVSLHDNSDPSSVGEERLSLTERLADPMAARPDAAVLSAEDHVTLRHCLRCLPSNQARVIILHYLENVSLREVARRMTVTPARVSQLHHLALGRLKQAWQKMSNYA